MNKSKLKPIAIVLIFDLLILICLLPLMAEKKAEVDREWMEKRAKYLSSKTNYDEPTFQPLIETNKTQNETPEISPTPDDSPISWDDLSIYNRTAAIYSNSSERPVGAWPKELKRPTDDIPDTSNISPTPDDLPDDGDEPSVFNRTAPAA